MVVLIGGVEGIAIDGVEGIVGDGHDNEMHEGTNEDDEKDKHDGIKETEDEIIGGEIGVIGVVWVEVEVLVGIVLIDDIGVSAGISASSAATAATNSELTLSASSPESSSSQSAWSMKNRPSQPFEAPDDHVPQLGS